MPLQPYQRFGKWWAKGRVEYQGTKISGYYQCSTGAASEQAAWEWCRTEEARVIREHLFGPEDPDKDLTFAEAVGLYDSLNTKTAGYLIPIVEEIGDLAIKDITPKMVRDLAPRLYPDASTKTWQRYVITPVRSVINNAHDLGRCPPIRIKGYDRAEQVKQDKRRGSTGRKRHEPGSWEWILQFRAHAERRASALALVMFTTGARISQAISMTPDHLRLAEKKICIPGAKGHDDRWISIPDWLVEELEALPDLWPRGWERTPQNRRVFGYADRSSPRKEWAKACKAAGIELLPFHSAGRHGFGQEMNVRQGIDEKAAGKFGGWSDTALMKRTYTHAEEVEAKIHQAQTAGLKEAEERLRIKLRK